MVFVNYRPEYQHGWASKTYYTQLRLDALRPESAGELLEALLGGDPLLAPLKALLTARTVGNPLFLEESIRTLVETRALIGERGGYRLAQPVDTIQMPATVQAILASRIDRLPSEEKRLLQAAAVVGKDVPIALLQAISSLPEDELRQGLAHLQAGEFLYEASLFPDLEYTFKHALTHEVAYGSLLHERKRALHRGIVDAAERLYPDRLAEHVDTLAHHALRGELWDKAALYGYQAGRRAAGRASYVHAVPYLEQALEALTRAPDSREALELGIDARLVLRSLHITLGQPVRALDPVREALRLAEILGDGRRLAIAAAMMTNTLYMAGQASRAIEVGERGVSCAESLGDPGLRALTRFYLSQIHHILGDYGRARDLLVGNEQAFEGERARGRFRGHSGHSSSWLAWSLADLGEFEQAVSVGEAGIRIAEAAVRTPSPNIESAESGYWETLALAEELNTRPLVAHCHLGLGKLYRRTGKQQDARKHLATATRMYSDMGMTYWLEQAEAEIKKVTR